MIKETGVRFNAREFARSLEDIGRKANAKTVSGYLVDGDFVCVGSLEEYISANGGKEIEVVY